MKFGKFRGGECENDAGEESIKNDNFENPKQFL